MINSFGTGKPTEADGSGRKRTGDGEADGSGGSCSGCSAVRAVRLFGCSAVRLFGCSGGGGSPPRMGSGERSEAPTAAGASSSNSRFQQLIFLWLSPIGGSGWKPSPDDGKIPDVVVLEVVLSAALLPEWAAASGAKPPPQQETP